MTHPMKAILTRLFNHEELTTEEEIGRAHV